MVRVALRCLLACWLAVPWSVARAGEPRWELRLGLLAHDAAGVERGSADIAAEALMALPFPDSSSRWAMPRLALGAAINTGVRTNAGHLGALWQINLGERVFVEAGLGLAVHDGKAEAHHKGRAAMGCAFAFREVIGLGYRLGAGWSVIGSVEHYSNAGLCNRNRGLTHAGMRVGYAF